MIVQWVLMFIEVCIIFGREHNQKSVVLGDGESSRNIIEVGTFWTEMETKACCDILQGSICVQFGRHFVDFGFTFGRRAYPRGGFGMGLKMKSTKGILQRHASDD